MDDRRVGILHIETPPAELVESGGVFHGIQLWVNLPRKDKFATPRYQAIEGGQVRLLASDDGGALVRLIAGDIAGHLGPGATHTPITMAHSTIEPGARLNIPWNRDFNALVYVLSGRGAVGPVGHPIQQGQLAVLGPGDRISVAADPSQDAHRHALEVLILGGRPIREPVVQYGPFVMNTKMELVQALEDYNAGKFGAIPPNALYAAPRLTARSSVWVESPQDRAAPARRGVLPRSPVAAQPQPRGRRPRPRPAGRSRSRR